MPLFNDHDRAILESQPHDPAAAPAFELLKACLVWTDERPINITSAGYDRLCDLWVARAYMHRGLPVPTRFRDAWDEAQQYGLRWLGFRRVTLSAEDKAYFDASLRELESGDAY